MILRTRTLGSQGMVVGCVGLGCLSMSDFYGPGDDAELIATIDRALELGLTLFDTADVYGPETNEALVGRALRGHREGAIIATKFGYLRDPSTRSWLGFDGSPDHVAKACDASLRRLGVDVIDLYYAHRVDPSVPIEDTVGAMAGLVDSGKVRWLGLCEAGASTIRRANAVHPISVVQSEYSLWSRDVEISVVPALRELGIGLVPYSPLGRGFLTGRVTSIDGLAADDFRRLSPRFVGANLDANLSLLEDVLHLATELDVTPAQLALAWVLAQGIDVVPIPGSKSCGHLEENCAASAIVLNARDLAILGNAMNPYRVAGNRYKDMSEVDR